MSENLKLKKKEVTEILLKLKKYYDCEIEHLESYNFYINENTKKIYISNVDINQIEVLRVNSFGLYFATVHDNNRIRLSIEGSNLIEPKKNFVVLNKENLKSYVAGEDLFLDEIEIINNDKTAPFLIIRYSDENIGTMNLKDNILMNYVPKSRRLEFNKIF